MTFIADLHIHSRFSRATSKSLTLPSLAAWAACKGIGVLGSGDFTHPAWRGELREYLRLDEESGLYRLNVAPDLPAGVEKLPGDLPFFCLQAEISSIYRRGGRVRKVHNLVFMPNLEAAEKFCRRLALVGNLHSDGRPILGLDSRDLLEIVLECDPEAHLIPAHIWTPWFSLFGSRSGFDSIGECFGDLSSHIFALETGLSSDPQMNRLVSALDNYTLVSNSDAHSGANLGREANLFSGRPHYRAMFAALHAQARREHPASAECRFLGTMEFYPEEGKYHLDGHRACNVSLEPDQCAALGNLCPVCGKPLTIGVLHRVMELADREREPCLPLEPEARMLVPLPEILAEILHTGVSSLRVRSLYAKMVNELGPELDILCHAPLERVYAAFEPLGEAIARIRAGKVLKIAGFDGQFGKIRLFDEGDLGQIEKRQILPGLEQPLPLSAAQKVSSPFQTQPHGEMEKSLEAEEKARKPFAWSPEQRAAVEAGDEPLFVSAGPGSGKTRVLTGRALHLLNNGISPEAILAITFSRRAAAEMRTRLAAAGVSVQHCDTLHAFAMALRRQDKNEPSFMLLPEDAARGLFYQANRDVGKARLQELWQEISAALEDCRTLAQEAAQALEKYRTAKNISAGFHYLDYNDLLLWLSRRAAHFRGRFRHILVDEIQDFSRLQLEIVRRLLPSSGTGFFGIGDPDQAIYGFRGAKGQDATSLRSVWPALRVFHLRQSYRAGQEILDLASRTLEGSGKCGELTSAFAMPVQLGLFQARCGQEEAEWLTGRIGALIGTTSHTLQDSAAATLAPGDIAVLVRVKAQMPPIAKSLADAGIPVRTPALEAFWDDPQACLFLGQIANAIADEKFLPALTREKSPLKIAPQTFLEKIQTPENMDARIFARSSAFAAITRLWKKCGDWKKFFEEMAWLEEAERISEKAETVHLLTLHACKGLEFKAVFLPGLEDGILPFDPKRLFAASFADAAPCDSAEERRLLYVGITRASTHVFASFAAERRLFGRNLRLGPSPFLQEMRKLMRTTRMRRHTRTIRQPLSLLDEDIDGKSQN